jgi:hypothetical protein
VLKTKECCNERHGLSATIKLGSLEKTVTSSLFHPGLNSGTIFLWKKRCHMLFWGTTGYAVFRQKKRPKIFMMPNWFFDHLQLFLVQQFLIRCQTKVLLWRIHICLVPKWKNPGSGVPSLMAADKPCLQLQHSLLKTPFLYCLMTNPKWSINRTWSFYRRSVFGHRWLWNSSRITVRILCLNSSQKRPKSFKMPIRIRKDYLKKIDNFNCGLPWSIPELKPQI